MLSYHKAIRLLMTLLLLCAMIAIAHHIISELSDHTVKVGILIETILMIIMIKLWLPPGGWKRK